LHTTPRFRDPDVADLALSEPALTVYDKEHAITYVRMLDADAEGADWREVARIVLHIHPDRELDRARQAFESHLARAKWAAWIPALASTRLASHRRLTRSFTTPRKHCGCVAESRAGGGRDQPNVGQITFFLMKRWYLNSGVFGA
jgi:hypothetical protein